MRGGLGRVVRRGPDRLIGQDEAGQAGERGGDRRRPRNAARAALPLELLGVAHVSARSRRPPTFGGVVPVRTG